MAALSPPLRVCRGILKELRALKGPEYKHSLAYNYVIDQFRKNEVTVKAVSNSTEDGLVADRSSSSTLCPQLFKQLNITSERYCRDQREALHASHTYLCLLTSSRQHMALHNIYHRKGEFRNEDAAAVVGLRMPTQPGGKGWEE